MRSLKTEGISKGGLQLLAVAAMVVDHIAWGFVEFETPLGILMHLFGRLTLPIMCFFIAEGFKHTHDIRKYVLRMSVFAAVSVVPFYLFFHEDYGYRQNIIFDELIALLVLCALKKGNLPKPARAALVALLFVVSLLASGWPILPIIFVLIFYFNESFRNKAKWYSAFVVVLVMILFGVIQRNRYLHVVDHDYSIGQSFYQFGYLFALIPLYFYNGEKGNLRIGRYFFYVAYPLHFMILWLIKLLVFGQS